MYEHLYGDWEFFLVFVFRFGFLFFFNDAGRVIIRDTTEGNKA
jgi:hypothetical protein